MAKGVFGKTLFVLGVTMATGVVAINETNTTSVSADSISSINVQSELHASRYMAVKTTRDAWLDQRPEGYPTNTYIWAGSWVNLTGNFSGGSVEVVYNGQVGWLPQSAIDFNSNGHGV